MGSRRYFNPQNASPTYEEMGMTKPRKRPENQPLPVRYITCFKCHKNGGTLVKADNPKTNKKDFIHRECLEAKS